MSTNKCAKFQINCSNDSSDIKQKRKSKMVAWRPYWMSDRLQNHNGLLSYVQQQTCKISDQLLNRFFRYQAEMKIQDGRLAAIFNLRLAPKSKCTFVEYLPINVQNFRSIA